MQTKRETDMNDQKRQEFNGHLLTLTIDNTEELYSRVIRRANKAMDEPAGDAVKRFTAWLKRFCRTTVKRANPTDLTMEVLNDIDYESVAYDYVNEAYEHYTYKRDKGKITLADSF